MAPALSLSKPITIRHGLRFAKEIPVDTQTDRSKPATAAALLGADYPGMRPRFQIEVGDHVEIGQCLFTDRHDEAIRFVSPIKGRVFGREYGPRRTLSALVIRAEGSNPAAALSNQPSNDDETPVDGDMRARLLKAGFWPSFRARPGGLIPPSDQIPFAILVTAIDRSPQPVPPDHVIAKDNEPFQNGLQALAELGASAVYVCLAKSSDVQVRQTGTIRVARFDGGFQAGLQSSHVYALAPADFDQPVWTIGFQDVIAIGRYMATGDYAPQRVVALGGDRIAKPRLVETILGASLNGLVAGELADGKGSTKSNPARILSGSPVNGRESGYLGRYHTQVSATPARTVRQRPSWTSRLPVFGSTTAHPLVPNTAMDRALPANVLAIPLMRALSVGDAEAAKRLGALDLVDEDVAILNHLCTSGSDYRRLLRCVLDELAEDAA